MSLSDVEAQKRGDVQVPVLPPQRPMIITQPYSTDLVIDRVNDEWINSLSQRFYLYPIHVSLSFAMTKGLNSALYLLLLRLLHREYDGAFRLCDSIATDSKLSVRFSCVVRWAMRDPLTRGIVRCSPKASRYSRRSTSRWTTTIRTAMPSGSKCRS